MFGAAAGAGKEVLTWSINNYLGLANHPEVRKADADAAAEFGMAYPMGARMMSGQTTKHEELESALADFVGKKDAYVITSYSIHYTKLYEIVARL